MHLTLVVIGLATVALAMWTWNGDGAEEAAEKVAQPAAELPTKDT